MLCGDPLFIYPFFIQLNWLENVQTTSRRLSPSNLKITDAYFKLLIIFCNHEQEHWKWYYILKITHYLYNTIIIYWRWRASVFHCIHVKKCYVSPLNVKFVQVLIVDLPVVSVREIMSFTGLWMCLVRDIHL